MPCNIAAPFFILTVASVLEMHEPGNTMEEIPLPSSRETSLDDHKSRDEATSSNGISSQPNLNVIYPPISSPTDLISTPRHPYLPIPSWFNLPIQTHADINIVPLARLTSIHDRSLKLCTTARIPDTDLRAASRIRTEIGAVMHDSLGQSDDVLILVCFNAAGTLAGDVVVHVAHVRADEKGRE